MTIKQLIQKARTTLRDMTDVAESTTSAAVMIFNSHFDTTCPLCDVLVKKGTVHRCGITNKPK